MPPKTKGKGLKSNATAAPSVNAKRNEPGKVGTGKGQKKNSTPDTAAASSERKPKLDSKNSRKAMKSDMEAARIRERDDMMKIYDTNSSDDDVENERKSHTKFTLDKFGNTVARAKLAEDERLQKMRAEARARREARGIGMQETDESQERRATTTGTRAATGSVKDSMQQKNEGGYFDLDAGMAEIHTKLAGGMKLTHKEKRALQHFEQTAAAITQQHRDDAEGLASFNLTVRGGVGLSTDDDGHPIPTASAIDVIVPCFSISAPSRNLLTDATLRLVSGRRYCLLGPNGRGKTTLLKFIAARKLPLPAGVDVLLVQQEVLASAVPVVDQVLASDRRRADLLCEEEELQAEIEYQEVLGDSDSATGQLEFAGSVPAATGRRRGAVPATGNTVWTEEQWAVKLKRYAEVGTELEAVGADACEAKVRRILTGLGFTEDMQNGPSTTLSGGWRMRVALAAALFIEPKLLLLDEPTNHLDLNAVLWLDEYLSSQWNGTLLIVSHDADFLESVCTDIVHLDAAKLSYYGGSFCAFEGMRGQIASRKERDYKLQQKTLKEFKSQGMTAEKAERRTLAKLNLSELYDIPREYRVNFNFKPSEDREPSGVDFLDVSFSYGGSTCKQLFNKLRLRVDGQSRVAIVGPNGAGKSSLLRLLTGTLVPTNGEVLRHSRFRIGKYDQHFEELLPFQKTPVAYLTEDYHITVLEARKYLGMFGLDGARHMIRIEQLSGGQKARCVFAGLALQRPHLLVLDEPTNHLDMESVHALVESLKSFVGGVVLVSHDARLISALDCELWVCGDDASGLRVERRGFQRYRLDVLAEVRRREDVAARKAARRTEEKRALRERILAQSRKGNHKSGIPSKRGVETVFKVPK